MGSPFILRGRALHTRGHTFILRRWSIHWSAASERESRLIHWFTTTLEIIFFYTIQDWSDGRCRLCCILRLTYLLTHGGYGKNSAQCNDISHRQHRYTSRVFLYRLCVCTVWWIDESINQYEYSEWRHWQWKKTAPACQTIQDKCFLFVFWLFFSLLIFVYTVIGILMWTNQKYRLMHAKMNSYFGLA